MVNKARQLVDAALEASREAREAAAEAAAKLVVAKLRVERYANMTSSEEALMAALLPCGKGEFPEQTVTGEKPFKTYLRACCEDNCAKKGNLFERRRGAACGYALVFEGYVCPIDNSDAEFIYQRWEKMLRNKNEDRETDDGKKAKPSYSMELVPHRGTRAEFMAELFGLNGKVRRPIKLLPCLPEVSGSYFWQVFILTVLLLAGAAMASAQAARAMDAANATHVRRPQVWSSCGGCGRRRSHLLRGTNSCTCTSAGCGAAACSAAYCRSAKPVD